MKKLPKATQQNIIEPRFDTRPFESRDRIYVQKVEMGVNCYYVYSDITYLQRKDRILCPFSSLGGNMKNSGLRGEG